MFMSFSMFFSTVLENLQECQNTAKVRSFMDTFAWQPKSVHKTAKVRSFSMIFSTVLENV